MGSSFILGGDGVEMKLVSTGILVSHTSALSVASSLVLSVEQVGLPLWCEISKRECEQDIWVLSVLSSMALHTWLSPL